MRDGYIYSCGNPCGTGETRTTVTTGERFLDGIVCTQTCPPTYTSKSNFYCLKNDNTAERNACTGFQVGDYCFPNLPSTQRFLLAFTNAAGAIYWAEGSGIFTGTATANQYASATSFKKLFIKKGLIVGIRTDNTIMYGGAYNAPNWRKVNPPPNIIIEDISFDGDRLLALSEKNQVGTFSEGRDIYYTDRFHLFLPNWKIIPGARFETIAHFGTRLVGQNRPKSQYTGKYIYRMFAMRDFTRARPGRLRIDTAMNPGFLYGSAFAIDSSNISFVAEGAGHDEAIIKTRYTVPEGTITQKENPLGLKAYKTIGRTTLKTTPAVSIQDGQMATIGTDNNIYFTFDSLNDYWTNTNYGAGKSQGNPVHLDFFKGELKAPPITTSDELYDSYDPIVRTGIAKCEGVKNTRFVRISPSLAADAEGILSLSQVLVFSTTTGKTNLALKKPVVSAFTPTNNTRATTVVDGIYEVRSHPFNYHSPTDKRKENFLEINLELDFEVYMIILVFRGDCCEARNKGVEVRLLNSARTELRMVQTTTTDYEQYLGFCTEGFPRCQNLGTPGFVYGQRRRIYRKDECDRMGGTHDASIGECLGAQPAGNGSGNFSIDCAGYPSQMTDYPVMNAFGTGGTGKCVFNPILYFTAYAGRITIQNAVDTSGNFDLGYIRDEWRDVGFTATPRRSPCGTLNTDCVWDPNVYREFNKSVTMVDPTAHYKDQGLKTGLAYCLTRGYIPPRDRMKELQKEFPIGDFTRVPQTRCQERTEAKGIVQFLCPDGNAAKALLDGSQTPGKTFLKPGDVVCIKDQGDSTKNRYFCKSIDGTPEGSNYDSIIANSQQTLCSDLDKAISDISSNVLSLNTILKTATSTTDKVRLAKSQLQKLYDDVCTNANLTANPSFNTLCSVTQRSITEITAQQTTLIDPLIQRITGPITTILNSKQELAALRTSFNC